MTFGVDTDNSAYFHREPWRFQKLSEEQLSIRDMVREQIAREDDFARMKDAANNFNEVLASDGLLGRTAKLTSDFITVVSQEVQYETGEPVIVYKPETVTAKQQEGVFVGCDVIALNGLTPEFVYILEVPGEATDDELSFHMVVAAVEEAELLTEVEPEGVGLELELLAQIKNETVVRNLRLMGELKEMNDEVTADYLKEMSLLAIEILAVPEVSESKQYCAAVAKLFTEIIDQDTWYEFEGFDVERVERPYGIALGVNLIEAVGKVDDVTTIEDFEYIPATDEAEAKAIPRKTLQPAFVFKQDERSYTVPVQYVRHFMEDELTIFDQRCGTFREQFLEEYPNLFKEPNGYLRSIGKYISKKYFQKDDDGV